MDTVGEVKEFLISVATGHISTQPISDRPHFLEDCDVIEEIVESQSSEEAADFLEEIRREEEERARQLNQEQEIFRRVISVLSVILLTDINVRWEKELWHC